MIKLVSKILLSCVFLTTGMLCTSCDKIISMIKDEFNSERTPAIPKKNPPTSALDSSESYETTSKAAL